MALQIHQLTYFVAVARTRHFTQAAELSGVSQPSLSKQVRVLENTLGARLFDRVRGAVTLTAAGEALLPLAQRILIDVEAAQRAVAEVSDMRRGLLRLGGTPSLCAGLLAGALARFHAEYPGIDLQVREGGSRDLVDALHRGELDLALMIDSPRGADPDLSLTPLLRESLLLASPADAPPPTDQPRMPVSDLRGRPLVMFREGYDLRERTRAACLAAGFEPTLAIEGGEMDAVLQFVEAGIGLAVVPSMVLRTRPTLRGTPLEHPRLERTVALAHRREASLPASAAAFQTVLALHLTTWGADELGDDLRLL
ncbi:LysR substrate-binding domain-containing protein [Solicola sp. PLA-1-18]|uniref:LysR substrate-binding domain-containing protein n=1 Tax=Solicola sp. PLA-1-18 TaxID=3380532 RepID=UPI003B7BE07B